MLVYKPLCYRCWPEAQQRRRVGLRNANNGEAVSLILGGPPPWFVAHETMSFNHHQTPLPSNVFSLQALGDGRENVAGKELAYLHWQKSSLLLTTKEYY